MPKREEIKTTAKRGGKKPRENHLPVFRFWKTPFLTINSLAGRARLGVFGGGGHAALRRPLVVSSRHGHALLRVLQALGALVKGRSQKEISNHKRAAWCFRWRHAKRHLHSWRLSDSGQWWRYKKRKKCGPSIIFMLCDIVPQKVKSMRRISDWNKHFIPLAGIQSLAIYLFYTGRLDKLEIKESGAALFPQISIIVLEKKNQTQTPENWNLHRKHEYTCFRSFDTFEKARNSRGGIAAQHRVTYRGLHTPTAIGT